MTDDNFWLDLLNEEEQPKSKKRPTKLGRVRTHFPTYCGDVKWHDTYSPNKSLICTSRGCKCPTVYTYKGIAFCSPHLICLLSNLLLTNSTGVANVNFRRIGETEERGSEPTTNDGDSTSIIGTGITTADDGRKYLSL